MRYNYASQLAAQNVADCLTGYMEDNKRHWIIEVDGQFLRTTAPLAMVESAEYDAGISLSEAR